MLQDLVLVDWGQGLVPTLGVILSHWKQGRLEDRCLLLAGSSSQSDFKKVLRTEHRRQRTKDDG